MGILFSSSLFRCSPYFSAARFAFLFLFLFMSVNGRIFEEWVPITNEELLGPFGLDSYVDFNFNLL